jgi:hypothetical protein
VRLVAFVLNLALACYVLYMLITEGAPRDEILLVSIFLAAPISALLALFTKGGESWLGMYIRRKTLEERKKIEKLEVTSR